MSERVGSEWDREADDALGVQSIDTPPWLIHDCKRRKIDPPILGLNLRKSPSLLNLIDARLSLESPPTRKTMENPDLRKPKTKTNSKVNPPSLAKLKASNFPATFLRIGCWKRAAENESDVVAKIYFAKQMLVWEILEQGLKSKMEIQWSDIIAIRATYRDEQPDILEVELSQPPQFYHETSPQPKKHTTWDATSDFTAQQASIYRRHYLEFTGGTLKRHYENLLSSDPQLQLLSRCPFPNQRSPYFKVDCEMRGFPYELSMHRSMFPLLHNQPPQHPHFSNSITPQHIRAFEGLGPTITPGDRIPCLGSNMRIMAMNSPSSASNLIMVDDNAAINHQLNESTPLLGQGFQNLRTVEMVEHQHQEPPLSACAAPAPTVSPQRVTDVHHTMGVKSALEIIEEHLLSDLSPADEERVLAKLDSFVSYLVETTQPDP